MGRYANRFEAGGSVAVGSTFTAAAGGGNTKFAVAANGQILNRVDYPALSAYYGGQTLFDTLNITDTLTGTTQQDSLFTPYNDSRGQDHGGGQVAVKFSGFHLYMQPVTRYTNTGTKTNTRIWYTPDAGVSWKLTDFEGAFTQAGFVATESAVYICHESGMHRTTDGLNYSYVFNQNRVYHVTEQSGTVIFITGSTGFVTTSTGDFSSFTGYPASGSFAPRSIVNYSGVLYAFAASSTGVRYSTNTGQTWTSPSSGRAQSNGGYHATIANGRLLVFAYGTTVPIYEHSTNPTGTTNTWTLLSQNTRGDAGVYCTSVEYDSDTNNLLVGWQHYLNGNSAQEIYGYIVTGVTGASIPCTGSTSSVVFNSGAFVGGYSYPFFIASGSKKTVYNDWLYKIEALSGTWDVSVRSPNLGNAGNYLGYGMTPFIPATRFELAGFATLGTTNSGNNYIIKGNKSNYAGDYAPLGVCSIYVDISGYYKQLTVTSGSNEYLRANYGTNTGVFSSIGGSQTNMTLSEASGKYIAAWTVTGSTYSGVYYNRYDQTTLKNTSDFTRIANTYGNEDRIVSFAPKDDGIYFMNAQSHNQNSNPVTGVLVPASGSPRIFSWKISGTLPTVNSYPGLYYSHLHNEVLVSYYSPGTVTGVTVSLNQGNPSISTYTLTNETGGVINPVTGSLMVRSQNNYYVFDTSGNIYKGGNRYSLTKYGFGAGLPTSALGRVKTFREISETKIIGILIFDNEYGNISLSRFRATGFSNYAVNRNPRLFQTTDSTYYVFAQGGAESAEASVAGTGFFTVPNIPSPATGEAKYIIAR
jgi:hypothetical protein